MQKLHALFLVLFSKHWFVAVSEDDKTLTYGGTISYNGGCTIVSELIDKLEQEKMVMDVERVINE